MFSPKTTASEEYQMQIKINAKVIYFKHNSKYGGYLEISQRCVQKHLRLVRFTKIVNV